MGRIQLATRLVAAISAAVLVAPSIRTAHAVVPRAAEGFAPAPARMARTYARGTEVVPVRAAAAFDRLVAATGTWRGVWDRDTDVPVRLWGAGIAAPGANADAAIALRAARALIEAHLDLLAPGATAADLELIGNAAVESIGLRTVTFAQRWNGLRVVGATVSAVFKRDRLILLGSTAKPDVTAAIPAPAAAPPATAARRWLAADAGLAEADLALRGTAAPVIYPAVHDRASAADRPDVTYTVAHPLAVEATAGTGKWTVWVDAATGEPLARVSRLLYAQGAVTFNTPQRTPDGARVEVPAAYATLMVDGVVATTDHLGHVIWPTEASASVVTSVGGPYIQISDGSGNPLAQATLALAPGGTTSWGAPTEEFPDAQITAAAHGNLVKQHVRHNFNPRLPWVESQMIISVNEPQVCNAFADLDPDQIHFFIRGVYEGFGECNNTARIPDVVYHETGHNVHFRSLQANGIVAVYDDFFNFEIPGLSEGLGDSLAASISQSPLIGPGFFIGVAENEGAIRNVDPVGVEKRYPDDLDAFDPHVDGEIIAGALFDLRSALRAELGDARGNAVADRAFTGVMSLSTTFLATYADAIAADDDDGNLTNGTPHQCAISTAFAAHGLTTTAAGSVAIGTPTVDAGAIAVDIAAPAADCPGVTATGVTATWQVRGDASQTGTIPFTATGSTWTGALPVVPDGTVVQYQLAIALSDGSTTTRPYNQADPYYETYVGAVTPIRCDDFETDAGWTHAAATGVDEWGQGAAGVTPAAGDPTAAHSGAAVLGTDLAANGLYAPGSDSYAEMPAVDTTGYATVRLQYRRWLDVDTAADQASISAGGASVWTPAAGGAAFGDAEWRFHDVELTAAAAAGSVAVRFGLTTDATSERGGWAVDDVCVVGIGAVCGDGLIRGGEACDDTNTEDGDGCSASCAIEPDDGGCCSTGSDPRGALVLAGLCLAGLVRRRKRA